MIVIVEGADLVGKSTLATSLARLHGWPIVKIRWALIGDPETETRAMAASTIAILQATRPAVIFDRIYFSWWAYGPVLGYPTAYMPELIRAYEPVAETRLVLLTATAEELARRFELRPDLYFSLASSSRPMSGSGDYPRSFHLRWPTCTLTRHMRMRQTC